MHERFHKSREEGELGKHTFQDQNSKTLEPVSLE